MLAFAVVTLVLSSSAHGSAQTAGPPESVYIGDSYASQVLEVPAGGGSATPILTVDVPYGVAVDPSGDVFVAGADSGRVSENFPDGQQWLVSDPPPLIGPQSVAVNSSGDLVIADTGASQVLEIAGVSGEPAVGNETSIGTGLWYPGGVAIDAAANVFISDTENRRVVEVPSDGGARITLASNVPDPEGIAVDSAGDVFVTSSDQIVEIPAGGGPLVTVVTGLNRAAGVAVDPDGNLFVADTGNDRVTNSIGTGPASSSTLAYVVPSPPPIPVANLGVGITAPENAKDGTRFSEKIKVIDAGPSTARHITTELVVPRGVTVANRDGATEKRSVLSWKTTSLAQSATHTYTVKLKVDRRASSHVKMRATTSSTVKDPAMSNNKAVTTVHLG